jgi:membrane-associated phospholipid phosphatase
VVLSRRWPRLAPAFWAMAALVSASRVYLNRHYTTDVLAAVLLGTVIALLVAHAMRWRRAPAPGGAPAVTAPRD